MLLAGKWKRRGNEEGEREGRGEDGKKPRRPQGTKSSAPPGSSRGVAEHPRMRAWPYLHQAHQCAPPQEAAAGLLPKGKRGTAGPLDRRAKGSRHSRAAPHRGLPARQAPPKEGAATPGTTCTRTQLQYLPLSPGPYC